jgi:GT2 family glycosyltransferase/glycosyltransferase involved in cell wall biosynthesis/cell division septum initiation protein DivIVA
MKLLVVGMHRSGTSAVGRLLSNMGIPTADSGALIGADSHNRLGHFEIRALTDFNDDLLAELGGHWAAPPPPGTDATQRQMAESDWGDRARVLLDTYLPNESWYWKDPRLSLLLPFWTTIIGTETCVLFVHRTPDTVAASLAARNGFSRELSLALWKRYVFGAAADLDQATCFAIAFDSLVEQPDEVLPQLRAWLESKGAALDDLVETPIVGSERHHVPEPHAEWIGPPDLRGFTGEWRPLSVEPADPAVPLSAAAPALVAVIEELEQFRSDAQRALDDAQQALDEQTAELNAGRAEAQAAVDHALQELEENQTVAQAELDRLNVETATRLDAARAEIGRLTTDLHAIRDDFARLVTEHEELTRETAHLSHVLDQERSSTAYQAIAAYRRVADRVLPPGSTRRSAYERSVGTARNAIHRRRMHHDTAPTGVVGPDVRTLQLRCSEQPVASLVIPVHGGIDITERLLESIAQHTSIPHEVIVIDDASPDDLPALLAQVEGIQVITNVDNQGYLRSTNLGASAARGEFVVLLNSDTEVTPQWLEHLLEPFDEPDVGAVGARLVYPDGQLQEAGSIIWSDGNGWNYGKGGWAHRFDVMRRREVDYCSAACLAVRRSVWTELGGFDERYAPAYYEDADLCFGIRNLGMKVIYQPRALIVHHEGASHGTDLESGMKAHQVANRATFAAKWREQLADQPAPDPNRVRRASDRETGPCILVVDHVVPTPDRDAGSLRMSIMLELLREQGFRVRFFPDNQFQYSPYEEPLQALGIEVAYGSIDPMGYLTEHGGDFDLAILSRPQVAIKWLPILRTAYADLPVVYDMVDLHQLREERQAAQTGENTQSSSQVIGEIEDLLVRVCDMTFAVTEEEATIMRHRWPGAELAIIPTIHERERSRTPFDERHGLLFVGSWAHHPNRDAIAWIVEEIQPLLRDRLPGVRTHIVGSDVPPDVAGGDDDIVVHGWVEDLDGLFDQIRLSVAPLRYGAGMKGKVGDSLARGVPIVVTPVAAEGFDLGAFDLRPTGDALSFVDRVVELYTDRDAWERTADGGMAAVTERTGRNAVKARLEAALTQLLGPSDSSGCGRAHER